MYRSVPLVAWGGMPKACFGRVKLNWSITVNILKLILSSQKQSSCSFQVSDWILAFRCYSEASYLRLMSLYTPPNSFPVLTNGLSAAPDLFPCFFTCLSSLLTLTKTKIHTLSPQLFTKYIPSVFDYSCVFQSNSSGSTQLFQSNHFWIESGYIWYSRWVFCISPMGSLQRGMQMSKNW